MSKVYIERQHHASILAAAFKESQRSHESIVADLSECLKRVRNYIINAKNDYPNQNSWPCGMQDAFADKVDHLFRRFEILKCAYKLSKGDATKAKYHFDLMIGEEK